MAEHKTEPEKMRKLAALIKDASIAMLTTVVPEDGSLRSRPMAYRQPEEGFDGHLYFFTRALAPKTDEVARDEQVNVSFSDPKDQDYVSISGVARLSRDRERMKELWNPFFKAWFPEGLDDPELALLIVDAGSAEYWSSPHGAVVMLFGAVKAAVTGTAAQGGENEKIDRVPAGVVSAA